MNSTVDQNFNPKIAKGQKANSSKISAVNLSHKFLVILQGCS